MNKRGYMLNNKAKIILFYWFPVFAWCALIYHLSSLPSLRSDFPDAWDTLFRKLAHITEFTVLTFLFFRASAVHFSKKHSIFYAVLFTLVFAFTDEYHQSFVYGRNGNLFDIIIDSLGIFLAFYLIDRKSSAGNRKINNS
jgi:VanZ family protein